MIAFIEINHIKHRIDLSQPIDISIPLRTGKENVNAFYADEVKIEAYRSGSFVGDVVQGGSVNYRNISFNPHGNGTHTECVGHISKEWYSINQCLKQFWFLAKLITVTPIEQKNGDKIIMEDMIPDIDFAEKALIVRTLPNDAAKLNRHYSGNNPPYFHHKAIEKIVSARIDHLLTDLPSIDKEQDEGKLLAHKAFWNYPQIPQLHKTITEMIYVDDKVQDGLYVLNIQIASFENDACPSKPVLYVSHIINQ
jgi:kynurenine formamidase